MKHLSTDLSNTPRPELLIRPNTVPLPFPVENLGVLEAPARAIATLTQAPIEIGFQSLLATSALVAQQRANVETLAGEAPLCLFLLTVAASGERKSSCDKLAMVPVQDWEERQYPEYLAQRREYERDLDLFENMKRRMIKEQSGGEDVIDHPAPQEPVAPVVPRKLLADITFEGVLRHFDEGDPSVGLFADEGGQFFGGHAMSKENQLKTSTGLSKLWDGAPLNRTRAGSPQSTYRHRRGSLHFMIQPGIAKTVFSSEHLKDQGFLSRTLIAVPESRIGQRIIELGDCALEAQATAREDLKAFHRRLQALLELEVETRGSPLELNLPTLRLQPEARDLLIRFANEVERQQAPGAPLASISGFASKAAEQAARIAGVLIVVEDPTNEEVDLATMRNAVQLVAWYISEAQRALDAGYVDPTVEQAQELLNWIVLKLGSAPFDKRTIVRRGPSRMRDTETIARLLALLERHHCILRYPNAVIEGKTVALAWKVNKDA